jgi:hypothetical protein
MRTPFLRRVVPLALTLLVALAAVVPVAPADARSPLRKIEPRRTTHYRIGRAVTPDTDILSVSGYAAWMIDEVLGATTPLPRLGSAFMAAERREGVNARYFVAHAMLESGWGTSDIARLKHNLFGYGAYDRDPWANATRFRNFRQGILSVAKKVHERYLTPGGRWWYGFTTLRGVNRYYASDVHWADKIARLANVINGMVVTLKERRLRFGHASFADTPIARAKVTLRVPWKARPGAVLPRAIRFRVRWTPVALVEASAGTPGRPSAPRWTSVTRKDGPGRTVRLALRAPSQPGVWRVDIEARDSDGTALPKTDNPRIQSLTVRVAAVRETSVGLSVGSDGRLAATVRNLGGRPLQPGAAGAATTVEAWALPLDPTRDAYRLASVALRKPLAPDRSAVVRFAAPSTPSVVVVRLAGDAGAIGRSTPVAALVTLGPGRRPVLTGLPVASQRDDALLHRTPPKGRIALAASTAAGTLGASVIGGSAAPDVEPAVAAMEGAPGRPWLLVRSLAAEPERPADPSRALLELPEEPPTPARLDVTGLPAGVRLVVAGIVAADGTPADPRTLFVAWIPVAAVDEAGVAAH